MSEQENVAVIRAGLELINERRLAETAQSIAPGFARHDLAGTYPGVTGETVVDFLTEVMAGAPDLRLTIEDIFASGDRVAVRLTLEGTHQGPLFGREGTGQRFVMNQVNIYRFESGKIAETWQLADIAGFMSQIGG